MDLTKLTKEELLQQILKIKEELIRRDGSDFPYKEGDCFYRVAPSAMGHGIETCRIDHLTSMVNVTMLVFDACNKSHRYTTVFSRDKFMDMWKIRISDKIFELHKENMKALNELNKKLVSKIIQLSKEYDCERN